MGNRKSTLSLTGVGRGPAPLWYGHRPGHLASILSFYGSNALEGRTKGHTMAPSYKINTTSASEGLPNKQPPIG